MAQRELEPREPPCLQAGKTGTRSIRQIYSSRRLSTPHPKTPDHLGGDESMDNHGRDCAEFETTLIPGKGAADSTVLSTGETLGPYQILGKLGEGGMGAVYKARHSRLDKMVAIKVLSAAVPTSRKPLPDSSGK